MPRSAKWKGIFKRDEPIQYYRARFKDYGGIDRCEKINSAKICRHGTYSTHRAGMRPAWRMFYCEREKKDWEGKRFVKCKVVGDMFLFDHNRQTYIRWYHTDPKYSGHGGHFYRELEAYLRKQGMVRLTLHSLMEAEGFWEHMGYHDVESRSDTDEEWIHEYSTLKPMHKPLSSRHQQTLTRYKPH